MRAVRHRPRAVVVAATAVVGLSVGPAAVLAAAAPEAPWAWPVAGTAAAFGSTVGWNVVAGRPWARVAALAVLVGATVEATLFALVNAFAFGTETLWPAGIEVAAATAVIALACAVGLVRQRTWFEPGVDDALVP